MCMENVIYFNEVQKNGKKQSVPNEVQFNQGLIISQKYIYILNEIYLNA